MQVSIEMAIRNAEAVLRMEGMHPLTEVLMNCRRVLDGEISHEQYVRMVVEKYAEAENVTVRTCPDNR